MANTLRDSVVFIRDKEGAYRGLLDVSEQLNYIEAMRERRVPDASITDRLRNEMTDILIDMDSSIRALQEKEQAPAPRQQPRPQPQPQQQAVRKPMQKRPMQKPEPQEEPEDEIMDELEAEISQEDDGLFDDEE